MNNDTYELISARSRKVAIQIVHGHFATQHSHVSHFIDVTRVKSETVSARAAARPVSYTHLTLPTIGG